MYKLKKLTEQMVYAANHPKHKVGDYWFSDFKTFYQPIVELSSGKVAGYEALARSRQPSGEYVSAGMMFADKALPREDKLLLDRHLRKMALKLTHACQKSGFITLNISPDWVDLLSGDHAIPTLKMISESGVDPERIIVEITEHCGSLDNLKKLTQAYHRAGLKVAIDDFGAEASQIDRVIELKPDFIKLDMGLFKAAAEGGYAADVVLSIVSIAQRAGCKIICEGVETEHEFHFAIECGADFIQGWLFDPALEKWVSDDSYVGKINRLKASFLERKSQRLESTARHNKEVAETLLSLSRQLNSTDPLASIVEKLSIKEAQRLGVLQFFLCDQEGNQISSNVIVAKDCLQLKDEFLGYNWSHRPYFPLLHAMNQLQNEHIVVSEPYRDISSGQLCKTHGVFISEVCVLLIDVLAEDVVLFQTPS